VEGGGKGAKEKMTYKIEMIHDLRMESATKAFQKKEGKAMEGLVSCYERTDKYALNRLAVPYFADGNGKDNC
jgi:hypothetical protein